MNIPKPIFSAVSTNWTQDHMNPSKSVLHTLLNTMNTIKQGEYNKTFTLFRIIIYTVPRQAHIRGGGYIFTKKLSPQLYFHYLFSRLDINCVILLHLFQ